MKVSYTIEVELTEKETDKIRNLNAKNGYGLEEKEATQMLISHSKARLINNLKAMALIEYRLTDINYHTLAGYLHKGLYEEAKKEITSIYSW